MRTMLNIFARSPFEDLTKHMGHIRTCVQALGPVFDALKAGDQETLITEAKTVSKLEHEADLLKDSIRNSLPRSLLMPVDRRDVLEIISAQDAICDCAEDVAVLLTWRPMKVHGFMQEPFSELVEAVMECVDMAEDIVRHMGNLKEASFRGPDRTLVLRKIDELARHEHMADKAQDKLMKAFFQHETELQPAEMILWPRILTKIGDLANYSERMANRFRLLLAN